MADLRVELRQAVDPLCPVCTAPDIARAMEGRDVMYVCHEHYHLTERVIASLAAARTEKQGGAA